MNTIYVMVLTILLTTVAGFVHAEGILERIKESEKFISLSLDETITNKASVLNAIAGTAKFTGEGDGYFLITVEENCAADKLDKLWKDEEADVRLGRSIESLRVTRSLDKDTPRGFQWLNFTIFISSNKSEDSLEYDEGLKFRFSCYGTHTTLDLGH